VFRPRRRIARLGVDSLGLVILYGLGVVGCSPSRTYADRDKTIGLGAIVELARARHHRSGGSLARPESVMAVNLSAGDLFRVGFSPG
jgi:hypothetical protein